MPSYPSQNTKLRQLSSLIIQYNWLLKRARNEGIIWSFHWELLIRPSYTFLGICLHCDMSGDAHKEYLAICPGPSDSVLWCYHLLMTSVLVLLLYPLSPWLLSSLPNYHWSPFHSWLCTCFPFWDLSTYIQPQENTAHTLDSKGAPQGLPGASHWYLLRCLCNLLYIIYANRERDGGADKTLQTTIVPWHFIWTSFFKK